MAKKIHLTLLFFYFFSLFLGFAASFPGWVSNPTEGTFAAERKKGGFLLPSPVCVYVYMCIRGREKLTSLAHFGGGESGSGLSEGRQSDRVR